MKTQCVCFFDDKALDEHLGEKVRGDFPALAQSDAVYFDNGATTQKPQAVLNAVTDYYTRFCANAGRGAYDWANKANAEMEKTRKKVAAFINADADEVFFTGGATESSNLIAFGYGLNDLSDGDEVMYCADDHKSTFYPYEKLAGVLARFGARVTVENILPDTEGDYKEDDLVEKVGPKTKIVVLTHIHNTYGLEMDIDKIVPRVRAKNPAAKIVLDCSQSVGHIPVDVKALDVDFAFFSGHKMFAETGVGVCYIRKDVQKRTDVLKVGGGHKAVEAGTQNISGVLSLGAAVDYVNAVGLDKISAYLRYLTRYLYDRLKPLEKIEFSKGIDKCSCLLGFGIVTFRIEGVSSADVGDVLNEYGIFVRTGDFCRDTAENDFIRVSFHIYNTTAEIDRFVKAIQYIISEI